MFLLYSIEDRILLKPNDLNRSDNVSYEEIVLEIIREKYIGKVRVLLNRYCLNMV